MAGARPRRWVAGVKKGLGLVAWPARSVWRLREWWLPELMVLVTMLIASFTTPYLAVTGACDSAIIDLQGHATLAARLGHPAKRNVFLFLKKIVVAVGG